MDQKTPVLSIERRGFYLATSECKYVTDVPLAPCKRCPHMPCSKTPPGRPVTRFYATARVAFPSGPRGRHPRAGDFGAQ